nr:exocyst complex component SEC10 [Tanacetum cinerariifolium]GFB17661.1 exocyst complex component SEC10 [Tanacetum cinerariifolium]
GNRLHKGTSHHWKKHTFNQSGGLRWKRDISEYGDFVRSFNAATVDEKFKSFSIMANVIFVAPKILSSLKAHAPSILKDAQ